MKYFLIYTSQRVFGYDGTIETIVNYVVSTEDKGFIETLGSIKAGKGFQPAIKSVFLGLGFEPYLIEDEEEEEDRCPLQWEDGWLVYDGDDEIAWQLTGIEELTEEEFKTLTKFHIGITHIGLKVTHKQKGA